MRQGLILTGLGIAVWGAATLFFRLFGDWVLVEQGDAHFGSSLFLLEMLTLLVLIGLALVVRLRWFRERGSATRFGYIATAVGLLLYTYTMLNREAVFPSFSPGQHQAFTVWMTLGYALTLLVPAAVDRLVPDSAGRVAAEDKDEELENTDGRAASERTAEEPATPEAE
ncbi:hypothetical protein E5161_14665 [Cohnella pontilimi]|uniref:Uncharacterized protein n=1 Tax=Cohnella pontilimi TaxID=2564100 RepID=A0A4U0F8G3_9BACL|nr:hypothetical protein [Cohnella pontilimi]TJY40955.1 hypothetical protein E5161_14665 [Cohnella pontilimi]